jgi:hypothetical protein
MGGRIEKYAVPAEMTDEYVEVVEFIQAVKMKEALVGVRP